MLFKFRSVDGTPKHISVSASCLFMVFIRKMDGIQVALSAASR